MIKNHFKSLLLLGVVALFLCCICYWIGGKKGLLIGAVLSIALAIVSYFYFQTLILGVYKAQPLDPVRYAHVHRMVEELCLEMAIPVPTLWLISTTIPSAFSVGRTPRHALVALTKGLFGALDDRELRCVLAHELYHIKSHDIVINSVAVAVASVIGYVATLVEWVLPKAGEGALSSLSGVLTGLIMPIPAALIQLFLAKGREFIADEEGAKRVKDPLSLASALEKLSEAAESMHETPPTPVHATMASLFIVYPFAAGLMIGLFSTHPAVGERILRLRDLARKHGQI